MQITNSLDKHKLHYERYNETKADLTNIHKYSRNMWVYICDATSGLLQRLHRVVHINSVLKKGK